MGPERSPLAGRTVVVTRSPAGNRSLAVALGQLGAVTVPIPLIEVAPPADGGQALGRALDRLTDYRWVVLTSANGVAAVDTARAGQAWPVGVTVLPVGPATEAAARAAGMTVASAPPVATAADLVAGVERWAAPGGRRVLAPLAELAGDTVVDGLTAKGYRVDRVTAYRTDAPADHSAAEDLELADRVAAADAVTFFSPSVVDRFTIRFPSSSQPPVVVCIGPATAERAEARGLGGVMLAEPHTEAGVVAAVRAALGS